MKFIHLADLHIGKKLGTFELIEDQQFALNFILARAEALCPDACFLAGDIFDRSVPSAEAVALADDFITRLARVAPVFIVGGNHDSHIRLGFARGLMRQSGVYISGAYAGALEKIPFKDEYGEVDIWLMPHILPREAQAYFEAEAPDGFECASDAVRAILAREGLTPLKGDVRDERRRVLIAHQFVTSARAGEALEGALSARAGVITSESEINPIGGLSEVDADALALFNYVALGHLHAPQSAGGERVRYSGSLLKYSFSEARHKKSFVYGDMDARGDVRVTLEPIKCLRDVRVIEGPAEKLVEAALASGEGMEDYMCVRLKGEAPAAPIEFLSKAYKRIVKLETGAEMSADADIPDAENSGRAPIERFYAFYRLITGAELEGEMLSAANEAMDAAISEAGA